MVGRRWPMLSIESMALMPRERESSPRSIWMYNGLGNLLGNDKGGNLDLERGSSYTPSLFFYKNHIEMFLSYETDYYLRIEKR